MPIRPRFLIAAAVLIATGCAATGGAMMSQAHAGPTYTADGKVERPDNWRNWIYVGTPLTPNALNGGAAPFPEFHNVYVEPSAFAAFSETGEWPEGTQIAKELVLVRQGGSCDADTGACGEVSGVGYFQGEFQGLELAVKDNAAFGDQPGGWAYFSFGHHAEPYAQTAAAFPAESCNACHEANADTDFVFSQFYPVIRTADPSK